MNPVTLWMRSPAWDFRTAGGAAGFAGLTVTCSMNDYGTVIVISSVDVLTVPGIGRDSG